MWGDGLTEEIYMKKRLLKTGALILLPIMLSGCSAVGEKKGNLSVIYGVAAVFSLLLLVGCIFLVRKNKGWFITLFSSVLVVNVGYTLLSVSGSLEVALFANALSYLGSVFLPLSMLMIILEVTNTKTAKWLPVPLFILSGLVFLVAASPGILDIYYKEVTFAVIDGVSTLIKVYGPLHPLYLVFLLVFFAAMIAVIIRAFIKKTLDAPYHATVLAIAVFVNIGVWLIEQLSDMTFEMLSVSYIISELFLLGVHMVASENQRLRGLVRENEEKLNAGRPTEAPEVSPEALEYFTRGLSALTPTERLIYDAYVDGKNTREVLEELGIKENTLKFHNKNLYGKLGVASRRQLLEISRALSE